MNAISEREKARLFDEIVGLIRRHQRTTSMRFEEIMEIVCDFYGVNYTDILGRSRSRNMIDARWMIFKILRDKMGLSLSKIGELTNKDHSSISLALRRFNDFESLTKIERLLGLRIPEKKTEAEECRTAS